MDTWALVTGASVGIGRELARVLAEHGHHLALVSRDAGRLNELAGELRAQHRIQCLVLPKDLSQPNAAAELFAELRQVPISVLVNNAGFGHHGDFATTSLALQTDMMQVNMRALVELTHLFLEPMLARKSGRILNVASTAAFQPGPTVNIYYATKAFVYSFSYALAEELAGSGVTVTALCPGMTRTHFFERAQIKPKAWVMMEARPVAEAGFRGMLKGKRVVIPGLLNKLGAFLGRRAPHALTSAVVKRVH